MNVFDWNSCARVLGMIKYGEAKFEYGASVIEKSSRYNNDSEISFQSSFLLIDDSIVARSHFQLSALFFFPVNFLFLWRWIIYKFVSLYCVKIGAGDALDIYIFSSLWTYWISTNPMRILFISLMHSYSPLYSFKH